MASMHVIYSLTKNKKENVALLCTCRDPLKMSAHQMMHYACNFVNACTYTWTRRTRDHAFLDFHVQQL